MSITYTVQRGDTLSRISRRFAVNSDALKCANPQIQSFSYIVPGQVLYIPERPVNLYVIQAGDTFAEIARRFNIAIEDLIDANPDTDSRSLKIGQTIVLPVSIGTRLVLPVGNYGYMELMEDLNKLQLRYPDLHMETIGCSVMGKPIPAIRLGRGPHEIHYNASFHASEWITSLLLMRFAEDCLLAAGQDEWLRGIHIKEWFDKMSLWLVPMVNPDGVELVQAGISPKHPFYESLLAWNGGSYDFTRWKANIRGVDLNDQFPAHWDEERSRRSPVGPSPFNYAGEAPLSEPEAKAMEQFTRSHAFKMVIAFHTQGKEIYWNYRGYEPRESEALANEFAKTSGYLPVELSGSDAGYKDWFIQTFRRPGFTVEAGLGTTPLPLSQFSAIYDEVLGIMLKGIIYSVT